MFVYVHVFVCLFCVFFVFVCVDGWQTVYGTFAPTHKNNGRDLTIVSYTQAHITFAHFDSNLEHTKLKAFFCSSSLYAKRVCECVYVFSCVLWDIVGNMEDTH